MSKTNRLTKSLLAAAAALLAGPSAAQAYDQTGWSTQSASTGWQYHNGSPYYTGGGSWNGSINYGVDNLFGGLVNLNLVYSGLFNASGRIYWTNNYYGSNQDYAGTAYYINGALQQSGSWVQNYNGGSQDWRSNAYFLPIDNASLTLSWDLWGDNGTWVWAGDYALSERAAQVARTGSGINGRTALSAFESDNQAYGSNYASYSNRNVLRSVSYNGTAAVVGSVVRNGDIQLGNLGAYDALYAKDAGWLDIRGSLTISSAYGHLYLRDAEITSTVFADNNAYASAQARTQGSFFFESGILSVRNRFAQDMYVSGAQTIAFRDGAVNSTNLYIDGDGYTAAGGTFGTLRSIAGSNVQNGNIGIGWLTGGSARIGVDAGSTLTINGTVNGVNGFASAGGSSLYYYVDGQLNQNGSIASGVGSLYKDGTGNARLSAANTFGGNVEVRSGSLTVASPYAIPNYRNVTVFSGASLVLDAGNFQFIDSLYLDGQGASGVGALRVASGTASLSYPLFVRNNAAIVTADSTTLVLAGNGLLGWGGASNVVFRTEGESGIHLQDQVFNSITNITKTGAGRLYLGHSGNAFTGLLDIQQGAVVLNNNALGAAGGPTQVAAGATLALEASLTIGDSLYIAGTGDNGYHAYQGAIHNVSGSSTVNGSLVLNDSATVYVERNTSLRFNGAVSSLSGDILTLNVAGDAAGANYGVATIAGNIGSSVWLLAKDGNGVAYVSGNNSLTNTRVFGGVLVAQNDNALGDYAVVWPYASLVLAAANVHSDLDFTGAGYGVHAAIGADFLRPLTFTSGSGQDGRITINYDTSIGKIGGGVANLRGSISAMPSPFSTNALAFHVDGGTLNVSGDIESSIGAVTKYGVGTTLAVSGNIRTTAALNVNEGTVALYGSAANLAVNIASGATLEVNSSNVFFNSVSSGLTVVDVASGGSLVLGANGSTVTDTILQLTGSGNISLLNGSTLNVLSGDYSGSVQSTGDLVKSGAANTTLLLTGASTYLGGTTVNGGTLNLTNVASLTSDALVNSGGIFVVNGHVLADAPNDVAGDVIVATGGLLKGSGIIEGQVHNSGVVAPGNSPGILTVNGGYAESGLLQIEIGGNDGAGVNPTGHDQLRITGGNYAITPGAATLQLSKFNGFEPARRDSYLAIDVAPSFAITGTFTTLDRSSFSTQLFFDHSNGKVYGSGLTEAQTFAEYGLGNANRNAVGYALYQDGLISADTIKNGDLTASTAKAFVNGSTDLGAAVEALLLAADPATVLDALSPEAYAGLGDSAARTSRAHFGTLGSAVVGATSDWDFSVGYTDQRFRTGTSTTSLDQLLTDSSTHLSANKAFNEQVSLAVLLSDERGHVSASNFAGSMTGWSAGVAGLYRGESVNVQLGYVHTDGSADVVRSSAAANDIGVHADSVELKVTPVLKANPKATYVLTPYASIVYTRSKSDAVLESSPGANLSVDAVSSDSAYVELGADLMGKFAPDLQWTLSAALATSLNSSAADVTARFADAGVTATDFTVRSGGIHGLSAKLGAGLVKDFGANTRGEIGVQGELGSNFSKAVRFDAKVSKRF